MTPCFFSNTSMTLCNAKGRAYNMSILPRMKLKNKIADMRIGHALLAGKLNFLNLKNIKLS